MISQRNEKVFHKLDAYFKLRPCANWFCKTHAAKRAWDHPDANRASPLRVAFAKHWCEGNGRHHTGQILWLREMNGW
jgi:hypothetical protein